MKEEEKILRHDGFYFVPTHTTKDVDFVVTGLIDDLVAICSLDLKAMKGGVLYIITPTIAKFVGSTSSRKGQKSGLKKLKRECKKLNGELEITSKSIVRHGYWYNPVLKIRKPL